MHHVFDRFSAKDSGGISVALGWQHFGGTLAPAGSSGSAVALRGEKQMGVDEL
jgi:hypothetical protein